MGQFKLRESEGSQIRREKLADSSSRALLDPVTRQRNMICDLFANQRQSIRSIAGILNGNCDSVARLLIEEGMMVERRVNSRKMNLQERRQSLLKRYIAILEEEAKPQTKDDLENIERSLELRKRIAGR